MDALISELRESGGLKRDGRRVTLEGVLTGAALGLFLVYTLDDLVAVADAEPLEGGAGSSGPARLPGHGIVLPAAGGVPRLDAAGAEPPSQSGAAELADRLSGGGGGGLGLESLTAAAGGLSARAGQLPGLSQAVPAGAAVGAGGGLGTWSANGPVSGGGAAGTVVPARISSVSAEGLVSGMVVAGGASLPPLADPAGVAVMIPPMEVPEPGIAAATEPTPPSVDIQPTTAPVATAPLEAGDASVLGLPVGSAQGQGGGGPAADPESLPPPPPPQKVLLVQVQSLIGADGTSLEGTAEASGTVRQVGLQNTVLDMRGSDADVLAVLSESVVPVAAVSDLDAATLEAITEQVAVLDSTVITGDSTSVVVIRADELLDISLDAETDAVADVASHVAVLEGSELTAAAADELVALQAQTDLQFKALGTPEQAQITVDLLNQALDHSVVQLAEDANTVVIDSVIGGKLTLPAVDGLQGDVSLNAQAVALDSSRLDTGAGDDVALVRAFVDMALENLPQDEEAVETDVPLQLTVATEALALRDSQIDLGAGDDQLLLQGGSENSSVDGGFGQDLLMLVPQDEKPLEVLVHDSNSFVVDTSLEVVSVETLLLGAGDDHVTLNQSGQLDGSLAGGEGVDTIDYSTRTEAVQVDLDRGIATDIGAEDPASLLDFEAVIGSQADDQLFFSSTAASADAGDGNDVLYLRWTPWMDSGDTGVLMRGGFGRDLFVLAGLDESAPADWDGTSGLPVFEDLELIQTASSPDTTGSVGLGLTDRLAVAYSSVDLMGRRTQSIRELTPSGLEGLGHAQLLPIAPTVELVSGVSGTTASSSSPQLAIGVDDDESATLYQISDSSESTSGGGWLSSLRSIASIRRSAFGSGLW